VATQLPGLCYLSVSNYEEGKSAGESEGEIAFDCVRKRSPLAVSIATYLTWIALHFQRVLSIVFAHIY